MYYTYQLQQCCKFGKDYLRLFLYFLAFSLGHKIEIHND